MRKTTITVFGGLSAKKDKSAYFLFYTVAQYFFEKGMLEKIVCLGFEKDIDIDRSLIQTPGIFIQAIFRIISLLKTLFPGIQVRALKEWIFDLFCCRNIVIDKEMILLNLKPTVPMTIKRIKRNTQGKDITVVSLASIAHPRFNSTMVRAIQKKYDLPNRSTYTNEKRVSRIEEAYKESDKVLLMVRSKFIFETYRRYGVDEQKLLYLGTNSAGVDTNVFKPTEHQRDKNTLVFLTLGNLTLIKGTPMLLDAWKGVQNKNIVDARLVLSGNTDADYKELRNRAQWQSINQIETTGYVSNLVAAYQAADIFIAASVSDNGPATVLEAMSCGLPVIVSTHCGYSEYIREGVDGFTYDPFDVDSLERLIIWFCQNRDKIPEMGRKSRERAKDFPVRAYVEQVYSACYSAPGMSMG
ncbi:MAG: glycosyltransferase family 4 protein [Thiotrichaceae bacterium]